jgi:hypothetical protein
VTNGRRHQKNIKLFKRIDYFIIVEKKLLSKSKDLQGLIEPGLWVTRPNRVISWLDPGFEEEVCTNMQLPQVEEPKEQV